MKKTIIISIGVGFIVVIAIFIYFVTGVSSTYAPIREYEFAGNTNQLIAGIHGFVSTNSKMTFKVIDKTGNEKNGYATYISIETENIEYSLKCEQGNSNNNTAIKLVGAYDKAQNIGGYSKSAKGIDSLANQFNLNVLKPLRDKQGIKITAL